MKLFIDCEFTKFNGELMSMALVAEDGQEFYCVIEHGDTCDWVRENVTPILFATTVPYVDVAVSYGVFQQRLHLFLKQFDDITVVADWPDDIKYFCLAMITNPGECLSLRPNTIRMEIVRGLNIQADIPHNALSDARAIKTSYIKKYEANI